MLSRQYHALHKGGGKGGGEAGAKGGEAGGGGHKGGAQGGGGWVYLMCRVGEGILTLLELLLSPGQLASCLTSLMLSVVAISLQLLIVCLPSVETFNLRLF